jgi:sigma-B regulation protein RsbU (phosphoserine phosphatase)
MNSRPNFGGDQIIELSSLIETAKILNSSLDYRFILNHILLVTMGKLAVSKSAAFVKLSRPPGEKNDFIKISKGITLKSDLFPELLSLGLENWTEVTSLHGVIAHELTTAGANMIFPIRSSQHLFGYLLIGKKLLGGGLTPAEVEFVSTLCNLATMAIDNARLFEESLAKQRLEEELKLAHEIQEKLLPKEIPKVPWCDISAFYIPTKQVGGDYFDIISLDDGACLCTAIADVSGKGFPAALLMANLQSAFRALMAAHLSLKDVVRRLNKIVYENTNADKFITFFAAIISPNNKTLTYVNAGHNYPFLIKRGGEVSRLEKGGLMLGVMNDVDYQTEEKDIEDDDVLYLFTDGISEALNSEGEEFTEARLEHVLRASSTLSSSEVLERVGNEIASFVGNSSQSDDITQICLKFSLNKLV